MSTGINRKGFTFYLSFYEALQELDDLDRVRLYDAICKYSLFEELPNLSDSSILRMAWRLIEPTISSSLNKSKAGAASTGERPSMRGNKNAQKKHQTTQNNSETTQEQRYIDIDKDIDIDYYMEELEISDRHFVHSLGIKNNPTLSIIVCKVVGMGFANGSYKSNKQNFLNKCNKIMSYMGKYNVSIDEWSESACKLNELHDVSTDNFFKEIKNRKL